ncbi:MAG: precorrin-3B C(17)-methyltransferase [Pseudomonadota bacterium]
MKPVVLSFSAASHTDAANLAGLLGGKLVEDATINDLVQAYRAFHPIIAFAATAIVIRGLAHHLYPKNLGPPVLCLDASPTHVIVLLGGHHGANHLARQIAELIGVHPVITTASDARDYHSLEEPPHGWRSHAAQPIKPLLARMAAGVKPSIHCEGDWGFPDLAGSQNGRNPDIFVGASQKASARAALSFFPPLIAVGFGCERMVDTRAAIRFVTELLEQHDLAPQAVAGLATIMQKSDEPACHALAAHFNWPIWLYSSAYLNRIETPNPSDLVLAELGTRSVSEAAACALAGPEGQLIVPKHKYHGMTCAIARAPAPIDMASHDPKACSVDTTRKSAPQLNHVQPLGRLDVVGTGPGGQGTRSHALVDLLRQADHVIGYGLYLDLIADLIDGKIQHRTDLGSERERVELAIALADQGVRVALVCSGDPGIYALAALVFEQMEQSDRRYRFQLAVHPGISAFQMLAARVGAMIGHDFCAISLSDLLTPKAQIIKRLNAAAEGDFVTALYNPQSGTRTELLAHAHALFKAVRGPDTPVAVGRNLARKGEQVICTSLDRLDLGMIDMLTLVMIGNSQTCLTRQAGQKWIFTPRGYHAISRV